MYQNLINQGFLVDAKKVSFLHHPTEFKDSLLSLISNAKYRILFNCLYLEKDESGTLILNALKEAVSKNPHLKVDICLDIHRAQRNRLGEARTNTNANWYLENLQQFNQELQDRYNLKRPPICIYGIPGNGRELFGVYHIKGYVFDDLILYSGASINNNYCAFNSYRLDRYHLIQNQDLADAFYDFTYSNFTRLEYQDATESSNHYNDYPLVFSKDPCPEVNKQLRLKYKTYRQNFLLSKELKYKEGHKIDLDKLATDQIVIKPVYGLGKNNPLNAIFFRALALAKESIVIYTPYFNFTKSLTKKIIKKCQEGVKVKIILSDKTANDFYQADTEKSYTSANSLPYLYEMNLIKFIRQHQQYIDKGVLEIYSWKDKDNSYHAKGLTIDEQIIIFTGSNLNLRSFNVDLENGLICFDPHKNLKPILDKELAHIQPYLTQIKSVDNFDHKSSYPPKVRKTLKRASFLLIDKLAKRLF